MIAKRKNDPVVIVGAARRRVIRKTAGLLSALVETSSFCIRGTLNIVLLHVFVNVFSIAKYTEYAI